MGVEAPEYDFRLLSGNPEFAKNPFAASRLRGKFSDMSENDDLLFDRFRQWMESHHVAPHPGVSSEALDELEHRNGWKFPEDVRRCLAKVNGCVHGFHRGGPEESREFLWDFYPVREWAMKSGDYFGRTDWAEHGAVIFCDHMIEAPSYLLCLAPASPLWGRVVIFNGWSGGLVGENSWAFPEFVRLVIEKGSYDFPC